jgi:hypothetical protein
MSDSAAAGFRAAVFAAVCWVALGLDSIVRPEPQDYRDVLWLVPFLATMSAFRHLHGVQAAAARRSERYSFYTVMVASALALTGMAGIIFRIETLAALGFPGGAIVWTVGLIWFGIATWRAGVFPAYVGISLILLEPGSILTGIALWPIAGLSDHGAYSAGIEKGAVMAVLALGFRAVVGSDRQVRYAHRETVPLAR